MGKGFNFLSLMVILVAGVLLSGCKESKVEKRLEEINSKLSELESLLMPGMGKYQPQFGKEYKFDLKSAPLLGKKNAPVKFVIWSDFQCPYCKRMGAMLEDMVKLNQDKFALYYKNRVVHPNAQLEHLSALAAQEQGKFWEMHDLLFENQGMLVQLSRTEETQEQYKEKIMEFAKQIGLNLDKFQKDLEDPKLQARLAEEMVEAEQASVYSTPGVFINGYFYGYQPELIKEKAYKMLEKKDKLESTFEEIETKLDRMIKFAEQRKKRAEERPGGPEQGKKYEFDLSKAPVIGNPNAKVKIVVFTDFQCPFCERMAGVLEEIQKEHPNDIAIHIKNFVVHPSAQLEHIAGMSANSQGRFKEMHDLLFSKRKEMIEASQGDPKAYQDKILELAKQIGLNTNQLKKDLESEKYKELLEADGKEARSAGVSGTPSVFINGYFYGFDPEVIKSKIKEELNK